MFTQSQLETLHNLVNREMDRMYENEISYNRDILLSYITNLKKLRAEIEKHQSRASVINLTEVSNES